MPQKTSAKGVPAGFLAQAGKGRPKGVKNKTTNDVRVLAQQYGAEAVNVLAAIMRDGKKPAAARISAAKEILDRAYGKSPQPIAVNNADMAEVFAGLMDKLPG